MRTTIDLAADVLAAVEALQREKDLGRSEAVNELVRAGMTAPVATPPFVQRTSALGLRLDVSNVGDALEVLEGPQHR